ncbi:MAG TPA: globin domain-containing protein, partial [Saprospiraceae bacterium]|nr:globin domain-containing protein [Saprospiraceae bacterium]
ELFYNRLFEIAPEVKSLFHSPMPGQSRKLISMLSYVISKLNRLEDILEEVAMLAKRHVMYGVKPEFFTPVGAALLWTLEQELGEHWNEDVKEAWIECYCLVSSAMIESMAAAEHQAA